MFVYNDRILIKLRVLLRFLYFLVCDSSGKWRDFTTNIYCFDDFKFLTMNEFKQDIDMLSEDIGNFGISFP